MNYEHNTLPYSLRVNKTYRDFTPSIVFNIKKNDQLEVLDSTGVTICHFTFIKDMSEDELQYMLSDKGRANHVLASGYIVPSRPTSPILSLVGHGAISNIGVGHGVPSIGPRTNGYIPVVIRAEVNNPSAKMYNNRMCVFLPNEAISILRNNAAVKDKVGCHTLEDLLKFHYIFKNLELLNPEA